MDPIIKLEGFTVIPPEILEKCRERCELPELTVNCLRKQLKIWDNWFVLINGKKEENLETIIQLEDQVSVLPIIAGGL